MTTPLYTAYYALPTGTDGLVISTATCQGNKLVGGYLASVTDKSRPRTWIPTGTNFQLCPRRTFRYNGMIEVNWDGTPTGFNVTFNGHQVPLLQTSNEMISCNNLPSHLQSLSPVRGSRQLTGNNLWWILLIILIILILIFLYWWWSEKGKKEGGFGGENFSLF